MKSRLLKMALIGLATIGLASCNGNDNGGGTDDTFASEVKEAQSMTNEELLAKAKTETGSFIAYGNSSRIATAATNFLTKYGEQLGLTADTCKGSKLTDSEIYTSLQSESAASNKSKNASFALVQDSATLALWRSQTKLLTNYVSTQFSSNVDEDALVPLTHQYINKLFIWNNTAGDSAPKFSNVWELTEAKYSKKIYFKSPKDEQVNLNFLITLTSSSWVTKMEAAYKEYYKKDFVKGSDGLDASRTWIKAFLANADTTSYTSDTKMAAGVSKAENSDKVGLFVLSKLRDSSVTSENLTVGAWQTNSITPFAGFMYSLYAQICTNGPRPYTAMLFTNYLMTSEGFAPWLTSVGGYSANKTIAPYEGDKTIDFYKQNLVIEDGEYINTIKVEMTDWINGLVSSK